MLHVSVNAKEEVLSICKREEPLAGFPRARSREIPASGHAAIGLAAPRARTLQQVTGIRVREHFSTGKFSERRKRMRIEDEHERLEFVRFGKSQSFLGK